MRRPYVRGGAVLVIALGLACSDSPISLEWCVEPPLAGAAPFGASLVSPGGPPIQSRRSPFHDAFAAAGAEFGVPPALLAALAWVETRWHMAEGAEEFPGRPPAFGVMALRGARLERGAALAGVTVEQARRDPLANVRAAAALVDREARDSGVDRSTPAAWAGVVAAVSGIDIDEGRAAYVRAVNAALVSGGNPPEAASDAAPRAQQLILCPELDPGTPDAARVVWRPSPNFNDRPADATGGIHAVIIHTCEGNYTGCWSWLVNRISQVSAHYVVNEDGTEISQLVREPDRAWHIAALYDCSLNSAHDCWLHDVQSNDFTIGIEHAGFASQDAFPASQIEASAALVCDVTRDHGIPRDWQHILSHGQLQPQDRTDPGPNWPWVHYLHRIQAHCGELVVDDDDSLNLASAAGAEIPAEWPATDQTPDYYGGGYRWAPTLPDAVDAAVFRFHLDAPGTRTLDARWTSGSNRAERAAYAVITAAGDTLATVVVDQTEGGGEWHSLGTWSFPAGWNQVALGRRDAAGAVVVADAVRVR